jgi:hypothetical protein
VNISGAFLKVGRNAVKPFFLRVSLKPFVQFVRREFFALRLAAIYEPIQSESNGRRKQERSGNKERKKATTISKRKRTGSNDIYQSNCE